MSTGDPWGQFARDPRVAQDHHRRRLERKRAKMIEAGRKEESA